MVITVERVESGMRSGKIACAPVGSNNIKKPPVGFAKKNQGETNVVMINTGVSYQPQKNSHQPPNFQPLPPLPYTSYLYVATSS